MWRSFSTYRKLMMFTVVCLLSVSPIFGTDKVEFNPLYVDSLLLHKVDTSSWNQLTASQDIHRPPSANLLIQQTKLANRSPMILLFVAGLFLIMLILKLIFADFAQAMLEGVLQLKKFMVHFKSNKYDTLLAVLFVYVLKILLLSFIIYMLIQQYRHDDFTSFNLSLYLFIASRLLLFFIIKNILEYIFNSVISTEEVFRSFFLQTMFAEFFVNTAIVVLLLIYIYNTEISFMFFRGVIVSALMLFVVFNIIRSYQLMYNIRLNYWLHFFLYICAFKIIPILLLSRYILNHLQV